MGTIANIIQLLKLPDGTVKVLVEGQNRAKINSLEDGEKCFSAQITPIETTYGDEQELVVAKVRYFLSLKIILPSTKSAYRYSQCPSTY